MYYANFTTIFKVVICIRNSPKKDYGLFSSYEWMKPEIRIYKEFSEIKEYRQRI